MPNIHHGDFVSAQVIEDGPDKGQTVRGTVVELSLTTVTLYVNGESIVCSAKSVLVLKSC